MAGKYMKSRFFNSIRGDRRYFAEEFAEYFASFIGNGVYPNKVGNSKNFEGLKCSRVNGYTIKVKAGGAIINGYFAVLPEDVNLEVGSSPGAIAVRLNIDDRMIDLKVLDSLREMRRDDKVWDLVICTYTANVGSVKDTREDYEVCGWVETIISGNFDQIKKWFDEFVEEATDIVGGFSDRIAKTEKKLISGSYGINVSNGLVGDGGIANISLTNGRNISTEGSTTNTGYLTRYSSSKNLGYLVGYFTTLDKKMMVFIDFYTRRYVVFSGNDNVKEVGILPSSPIIIYDRYDDDYALTLRRDGIHLSNPEGMSRSYNYTIFGIER